MCAGRESYITQLAGNHRLDNRLFDFWAKRASIARKNNARQDRFHHERKTGCPVDCLKLYNALRHSLRASISQTSLPHNLPCSLIYILPSIWTMSRSSSSSASSGNVYSCYFVPGYRISRHVMFTNIHYYLGPCATVRPFSYQQREGYLVTNPGTPLTKVSKWQMTSSVFKAAIGLRQLYLHISQSQIEDLQYLSEQYEQQEAERMIRASGAMSAADLYINKPIPVQQRARHGTATLR